MRVLKISWGRLILLLGAALIILQLLHIILRSRLEVRQAELDKVKNSKTFTEQSHKAFYWMKNAIDTSQKVDSSGHYSIVDQFFKPYESKTAQIQSESVTLVTHCSANNLYHLITLADHWKGPISVSVFLPDTNFYLIINTIFKLALCVPGLRSQTSFHLVYPLTSNMATFPSSMPTLSSNFCDHFNQELQSTLPGLQNYALRGTKYPNNLLRNIAKRNANSQYVLVIDIDMVPNPQLYEHFTEYYKKQSLYTGNLNLNIERVFIVPAFEIENKSNIPKDKLSLLQMWDIKTLRPFYYEACFKCQAPTDYHFWKNLTTTSELNVGYEKQWRDAWEPFFIGPKQMPDFDERFKQYGFNRVSQVCELHVKGFQFSILNNGFLIHKGFKRIDAFHHSKDAEQEANRVLYRQFKEELKTKYPDSERRC